MKINIKAKQFLDKEQLAKILDNRLKKPVHFLQKNIGEALPFCYEVDYFSAGNSFISIGETKEVERLFKLKRSKGQGENGKIDKKKVAYGTVKCTAEGVFQFVVAGGIMKKMEAKGAIKSISFLKKNIGDKFEILGGEPVENEMDNEEATTEAVIKPLDQQLQNKIEKMQGNYQQLSAAINTANPKAVQRNIDKFKQRIENWLADDAIGTAQLDEIKALKENFNALEEQLTNKPASVITPEVRVKINKRLNKMQQQVDKFLKDLENVAL